MDIEYEAKFLKIDTTDVRRRLHAAGAVLIQPEFLQRRWVLDLPEGQRKKGVWLRVRDEGTQITLSWKSSLGDGIEDQREVSVVVDSFDTTVELLKRMGCSADSYQETKRELWVLDGAKITIDTWPFLAPFVEVEADSEVQVRDASERIGFEWNSALFCGVNSLFQMEYGEHAHTRSLPLLTFEMENPFRTVR